MGESSERPGPGRKDYRREGGKKWENLKKRYKSAQMTNQMKEKQEELELLKTLLAQKEKENDLLRAKIQTCQAPYPLTAEVMNNSSVPNYFRYCTGDIITENMPGNYKSEFPTTFAILDCTEIKIEKPRSLLVQKRLKLWLEFVGLDVSTPVEVLQKADHRVCGLHFTNEDFAVGRKKSTKKLFRLNNTAVPTLRPGTTELEELGAVGGVEAEPHIFKVPESTPVKEPSTGRPLSFRSVGMPLLLTSPQGSQKTRKSLSGTYLAYTAFSERSTLASDEFQTEMAILDTSMTSVYSDDEKDMTFSLSSKQSTSSTASSSISSPSEMQSEWDDRKWIVNESHLMRLFSNCHKCGVAINEKKVTKLGSQIKVEWTCLNDHHDKWASSPDARGMGQNNLLIPAAILFTGTTFTEIHEWARLLNLQLPKKTQYYSVQSNYLFPVIHQAYKEHQEKLIQRIMQVQAEGKPVELCGDARSDSPGHNCKYSTYSFQLLSSNEIIHFELLQVTEASSSVAMESEGFRRGLNELLYKEGVDIDLIATDDVMFIKWDHPINKKNYARGISANPP
ncbi:unnamed protein product [Leuciscus chuanchicus]